MNMANYSLSLTMSCTYSFAHGWITEQAYWARGPGFQRAEGPEGWFVVTVNIMIRVFLYSVSTSKSDLIFVFRVLFTSYYCSAAY